MNSYNTIKQHTGHDFKCEINNQGQLELKCTTCNTNILMYAKDETDFTQMIRDDVYDALDLLQVDLTDEQIDDILDDMFEWDFTDYDETIRELILNQVD